MLAACLFRYHFMFRFVDVLSVCRVFAPCLLPSQRSGCLMGLHDQSMAACMHGMVCVCVLPLTCCCFCYCDATGPGSPKHHDGQQQSVQGTVSFLCVLPCILFCWMLCLMCTVPPTTTTVVTYLYSSLLRNMWLARSMSFLFALKKDPLLETPKEEFFCIGHSKKKNCGGCMWFLDRTLSSAVSSVPALLPEGFVFFGPWIMDCHTHLLYLTLYLGPSLIMRINYEH